MSRQSTTCKLILACLLAIGFAACSPPRADIKFGDLPAGDAARGAKLFTESINGATPCSDCHRTDAIQQTGPGLGGFGARAGGRVSGESAEEYAFHSIVEPWRYVVRGFSNVMYNDFADRASPQDIADLIAYLLTL